MKHTFSMILVALLVVACSFALVGCSSDISSEEEWNKIFDAYNTSDKITLKIEDNDYTVTERIVSTTEISYDGEKGEVFITHETTTKNIVGLSKFGKSHYEYYYVIKGTSVLSYDRYVGKYSQDWETPRVYEFDTVEEAQDYLRNLYLHPVAPVGEGGEYPNLSNLTYENYNHANSKKLGMFGKITWEITQDNVEYTHTLNLSSGKISKYTYEYKDSLYTRKTTTTVKYKANISAPTDLPAVEN